MTDGIQAVDSHSTDFGRLDGGTQDDFDRELQLFEAGDAGQSGGASGAESAPVLVVIEGSGYQTIVAQDRPEIFELNSGAGTTEILGFGHDDALDVSALGLSDRAIKRLTSRGVKGIKGEDETGRKTITYMLNISRNQKVKIVIYQDEYWDFRLEIDWNGNIIVRDLFSEWFQNTSDISLNFFTVLFVLFHTVIVQGEDIARFAHDRDALMKVYLLLYYFALATGFVPGLFQAATNSPNSEVRRAISDLYNKLAGLFSNFEEYFFSEGTGISSIAPQLTAIFESFLDFFHSVWRAEGEPAAEDLLAGSGEDGAPEDTNNKNEEISPLLEVDDGAGAVALYDAFGTELDDWADGKFQDESEKVAFFEFVSGLVDYFYPGIWDTLAAPQSAASDDSGGRNTEDAAGYFYQMLFDMWLAAGSPLPDGIIGLPAGGDDPTFMQFLAETFGLAFSDWAQAQGIDAFDYKVFIQYIDEAYEDFLTQMEIAEIEAVQPVNGLDREAQSAAIGMINVLDEVRHGEIALSPQPDAEPDPVPEWTADWIYDLATVDDGTDGADGGLEDIHIHSSGEYDVSGFDIVRITHGSGHVVLENFRWKTTLLDLDKHYHFADGALAAASSNPSGTYPNVEIAARTDDSSDRTYYIYVLRLSSTDYVAFAAWRDDLQYALDSYGLLHLKATNVHSEQYYQENYPLIGEVINTLSEEDKRNFIALPRTDEDLNNLSNYLSNLRAKSYEYDDIWPLWDGDPGYGYIDDGLNGGSDLWNDGLDIIGGGNDRPAPWEGDGGNDEIHHDGEQNP